MGRWLRARLPTLEGEAALSLSFFRASFCAVMRSSYNFGCFLVFSFCWIVFRLSG